MKKALIVGINTYPTAPLRGCVNDALTMQRIVRDEYKFDSVTMLLDNAATTIAMRTELNNLVANAVDGDMLFFHYSGHGSQMKDRNGDEADGLDEIIAPVDLDWRTKVIKDDELKTIFDAVPLGVDLVVSLDCCNSGTGLDQAAQYQPEIAGGVVKPLDLGGRFLPPPDFALEGTDEFESGFKPKLVQSRAVNTTGLLISACQSQQTSADAYIGGKYQGAHTYALGKILADNNYNMAYVPLVEAVNAFMIKTGFTQRPELDGSPSLFDAEFLRDRSITAGVEKPASLLPPVSVTPTKVEKPKKKKDFKPLIIGGIVVALAAVAYFLI